MKLIVTILGLAILLLNALGAQLPDLWGPALLLVAAILTLVKEFLEKWFPEVPSAQGVGRSNVRKAVNFILR